MRVNILHNNQANPIFAQILNTHFSLSIGGHKPIMLDTFEDDLDETLEIDDTEEVEILKNEKALDRCEANYCEDDNGR